MLSRYKLDTPVSFPKNDDEWHSFFDPERYPDAVERALKIKQFMDDLPTTSATFSSSRLKKDTGIHHNYFTDELMAFLGSWEVPEQYTSARGKWFVNPNYEDKHRYSDAAATCECGTPMLREKFSEEYDQPGDVQEHSDECNSMWRMEGRAKMWRKRHDIIVEMTQLGHTFSKLENRLGYKDSDHAADLARKCGLEPKETILAGRRRAVRTFIVLLRDYPTSDVAQLYGLSRSAVNSIMRTETTASSKSLYSYRRRMKKTGSVLA